MRWHSSLTVSRGGDNAYTVLVRVVNCFTPRARGCTAHADGHDVTLLIDCVSQGLRKCTRAKQHHGIRDAQRQDVCIRRASQCFVELPKLAACENADCSGTVSGVVGKCATTIWIVGAVWIAIAIYKTSLQLL